MLSPLRATLEITFWLVILAAIGLPSKTLYSQRHQPSPEAGIPAVTVGTGLRVMGQPSPGRALP